MFTGEMPKTPLKAIKAFCAECYGGSTREVAKCTSAPGTRYQCPLYPFRQGHNPYQPKRELTEEQRAANIERLAQAREKHRSD